MSRTSIDFADISPKDRYKLLTATVIPRPVAWVTTRSVDGVVNAAPYSFFNAFSEDPAMVVLGLQHNPDGSFKDTTRNIAQTGEFAVNIARPDALKDMVASASNYPGDISEPEALGLGLVPSGHIAPPGLSAAAVVLECRKSLALNFSTTREILLGEVLAVSAPEGLIDAANCHLDWGGVFPIARLFGPHYGEIRALDDHPIPPVPKTG